MVLHIPREVTWALHSDFAKRPATKAAKINLDGFRLFNGHDTQVLIQRFGDNDGVRRTPEYLAELVIEAIKSELLTEYTMSASRAMQER